MTLGDPFVTPKRKPKKALWMVLVIVSVVLAVCGFAAIGALSSDNKHVAGKVVAIGEGAVSQATSASPSVSASPAPAVAKKRVEPAKPTPVTVDDGVWQVGTDIPAGRYRLAVSPEDGCYWEVTKDDAGEDIVANDLPTGGHPQVTVRKGQFFNTKDCGTWTKIQ